MMPTYQVEMCHWRALFSDGHTLDFMAPRIIDSEIRKWVLKVANVQFRKDPTRGIEGLARVEFEQRNAAGQVVFSTKEEDAPPTESES